MSPLDRALRRKLSLATSSGSSEETSATVGLVELRPAWKRLKAIIRLVRGLGATKTRMQVNVQVGSLSTGTRSEVTP